MEAPITTPFLSKQAPQNETTTRLTQKLPLKDLVVPCWPISSLFVVVTIFHPFTLFLLPLRPLFLPLPFPQSGFPQHVWQPRSLDVLEQDFDQQVLIVLLQINWSSAMFSLKSIRLPHYCKLTTNHQSQWNHFLIHLMFENQSRLLIRLRTWNALRAFSHLCFTDLSIQSTIGPSWFSHPWRNPTGDRSREWACPRLPSTPPQPPTRPRGRLLAHNYAVPRISTGLTWHVKRMQHSS